MLNFINRMIRAAKLDVHLYEEIEVDKTALGPSMGVVVLSSVAAGLGSPSVMGSQNFILAAIAALLGWFFWAWLTYFIGTKILPEPQTKTSVGELIRTIGFSSSPGILRILGIIQPLAGIIFFVTGIWMLCAMIIAVRQALDYKSTGRAVAVCVIGWLIQVLLIVLLLASAGLRV